VTQFAVIIAAAGKSTRFGSSQPREKKVFQDLRGRPVWLRSTEAFINRDDVKQVLITINPEDMEWFKERYRANLAFLDLELVPGGVERADSVQNALARVRGDIDCVAIHDAARPLIAKEWISDVFKAADQTGAAILATPISSTIKRAENGVIRETVPRTNLWAAQTPQVFHRKLLIDAYSQRGKFAGTDDAQLIEQLGHSVAIVECSAMNMKITSRDDMRMANALLDALPKEKSLADLHPFAEDKPKWLME
jgi:2-C-methyl-D-erythritol 4-phosphate cytidylyltransferase